MTYVKNIKLLDTMLIFCEVLFKEMVLLLHYSVIFYQDQNLSSLELGISFGTLKKSSPLVNPLSNFVGHRKNYSYCTSNRE